MNEVLDSFVRGIGIVATIFLCLLTLIVVVVLFVALLPLLLPLLAVSATILLIGSMAVVIYLIGSNTKSRD